VADTDPLTSPTATHPELDITAFGPRDADPEREFVVDAFAGRVTMKLRDVLTNGASPWTAIARTSAAQGDVRAGQLLHC
jgi:2-oxoglutarate dehydrogenase complex dehydrogenase (E1) component-like enzyme